MLNSLTPQAGQTVKVDYPNGVREEIRIIQVLGQGGYNIACLVKKENDRQEDPFVLKLYLSGKEKDNREAAILAMLGARDLPVVSIRAEKVRIEVRGQVYQGHIENLAPGMKMSKQPPNTRQAVELAMGFARLLKGCAQLNIAYRDVKPEDHIFWQPDQAGHIASMTVIDWNIAQMPGNEDGLYHDLWQFCRTLPVFFTGQVLNNNRWMHPMEWVRDWRDKIDCRVWPLMADLSVNQVGPVLPDCANLLSFEQISRYSIEQAWERVISALEQTLALLNDPSQPAWPGIESPKNQALFQALLRDPVDARFKDVDKELITHWNNRSMIYFLDGKADAGVEEQLRLAHMLLPENERVGMTLAIYEAAARTGIMKEGVSEYNRLLKGLVNEEKPEVFNAEQPCLRLSEIAHKQIEKRPLVDIAGSNQQVWRLLDDELQIWALCEKVDQEPTLEKKHLAIAHLQNLQTHPMAAEMIQQVKDDQVVNQLAQHLQKAYNEGDYSKAQQYLDTLSKYPMALADKYVKRSQIGKVLGVCQLIEQAVDHWNPENNQKALAESQGLVLPERTTALRKRIQTQEGWIAEAGNLSTRIKQASFDHLNELAEISKEVDQLKRQAETEFPQLAQLQQDWQEKFSRQYQDLQARAQGTRQPFASQLSAATVQIQRLKNEIQQFSQVSRNCFESSYEAKSSDLLRLLDQTMTDLSDQARQKETTLKNKHQASMRSATTTAGFQDILNDLEKAAQDPDFESESARSWIAGEKIKVQKLLQVTAILQTYQQKTEHEKDQINRLREALQLLNETETGEPLREKVQAWLGHQALEERVLQKIQDNQTDLGLISDAVEKNRTCIQNLSDEMKLNTSEISHEVKEEFNRKVNTLEATVNQSIGILDKKLDGLNETIMGLTFDSQPVIDLDSLANTLKEAQAEQFYKLRKKLIPGWAKWLLLGMTGLLVLNLIGLGILLFRPAQTITAVPQPSPTTQSTLPPKETDTPTALPSPTTPARATATTPVQETQPAEKATPEPVAPVFMQLNKGAILYDEDQKTSLWSLMQDPPVFPLATVMETSGEMTKVQVNIVLGDGYINPKTFSTTSAGMNIRAYKSDTEEPPVIGIAKAIFKVVPFSSEEKPFTVTSQAWRRVVFIGWVKTSDLTMPPAATPTAGMVNNQPISTVTPTATKP